MIWRFGKPKVVISSCIEFAACRWNGLMISSEIVRKLKPHVEFITVCPEYEIGLGVPRKPIRVVDDQQGPRLLQSETGRDCTKEMTGFVSKFLSELSEPDGFILKDRSPSCGTKDVKIYPSLGKVSPVSSKGAGFFGKAVMDTYPLTAIENEGRLENMHLREHFLTRIFTTAEFTHINKNKAMKNLVAFHSRHKLLFMGYNQRIMRVMGKIVANHDKYPLEKVFSDYEENLRIILSRQPRFSSNINVLMHSMGYFKDSLTTSEKSFFLETLDRYRSGMTTLGVCTALMQSWIVRFGEQYLSSQSYFQPFPEALIDISTSGKIKRGPRPGTVS